MAHVACAATHGAVMLEDNSVRIPYNKGSTTNTQLNKTCKAVAGHVEYEISVHQPKMDIDHHKEVSSMMVVPTRHNMCHRRQTINHRRS